MNSAGFGMVSQLADGFQFFFTTCSPRHSLYVGVCSVNDRQGSDQSCLDHNSSWPNHGSQRPGSTRAAHQKMVLLRRRDLLLTQINHFFEGSQLNGETLGVPPKSRWNRQNLHPVMLHQCFSLARTILGFHDLFYVWGGHHATGSKTVTGMAP